MSRVLVVTVLVAGIVSWSCETGPPLEDPPSFDGATRSSSFVVHMDLTVTVKGSGTQKASEIIEYVSPDRIRVRQTGFDYLPTSTLIIGEDSWPHLTSDKRLLVLQWYSSIRSFEEGLAAGAYKSTRRGPRVQGEQTKRYLFSRDNIFGSIASDPELAAEAARLLRNVDSTFEVLVGVATGRIYRVDIDLQGPYNVSSGRLEITDFNAPLRIDPP